MHATYFEGNSKHDPGWYLHGKGPYPTKHEAEIGEEDKTKAAVLKEWAKEKGYPVVDVMLPFHDNEVKFLVKVERSLRSRLLAISIWLLFVPIFWYGVYKLTTWVIS